MTHSQFRKWIRDRLAEVEPKIKQRATKANAAIVIDAKVNAYNLGLYDLASLLPEPEKPTALDCCLWLRKCLAFFEQPAKGEYLISLADAAKLLGYQTEGLRKIVSRKQIQYLQVGQGRIKFRREWIDDFIKTNSTKPGVENSPAQKRQQRFNIEPQFGFDSSLFYKW